MRITDTAMRQLWQCHVDRLLAAGEIPMSYDEYVDVGRRLLEIEIVDDQVVERANVPTGDYPQLLRDSVTGAKWLLGNYNGAPCYHLISMGTVIQPAAFFFSAPGRINPPFIEVGP